MRINRALRLIDDETGSIVPLSLGFFLVALLLVGGGVAYSDAFTKQRDLQAVCDSAAVAAANNIDRTALPSDTGEVADAPLTLAGEVIRAYLDRDPSGHRTTATAVISDDSRTVTVTCRRHNQIAFGALVLRADGVDQTARSSARAPLDP